VLFAAGGTGGHVYPALAVADAVRDIDPEAAIVFAGTRERLEWRAVPEAGYEIQPIAAAGVQRSMSLRNLSLPFKVMKGFGQSLGLIRAFDPDVVMGTGGYVSGPMLAAAHLSGRATAIQEQNAFPGWTNRIAGRFADRIYLAFAEASSSFDQRRCVVSGNPIRRTLLGVSRAEARRELGIPPDRAVLAVVGGSLGSGAINAALFRMCSRFLEETDSYLLWQTGGRYFDRLEEDVSRHERLRLVKYVDRMDQWYAAADVFVCRAGAVTCSELLATGTPSILVPSPNVAEDHQTANARMMEDADAAVLLPENRLFEDLLDEATILLGDAGRLRRMSDSARRHARPFAATDIAESVLDLAQRRTGVRDGSAPDATTRANQTGRSIYA
jgi:UDP-N-acetylglucosamine--N-acetylmuramyl-(pentapeptide) pyrophosphoryl-undecaprenol N-acetylglucosamine transferase